MYPLVILAGGMAKRLGDISLDIPKCLTPIAGKPFIDWQVEYAAKQGVKDIYICSGWLTNKVEEHFNEYKHEDLNITVIADGNTLLGMVNYHLLLVEFLLFSLPILFLLVT